ncbi:hypothetical protein [Mycobacterium sp. URHD0025]|nr:hypothetical protein [Mycobacterium sp. URHD0025]
MARDQGLAGEHRSGPATCRRQSVATGPDDRWAQGWIDIAYHVGQ